jgi:hypothetical protein
MFRAFNQICVGLCGHVAVLDGSYSVAYSWPDLGCMLVLSHPERGSRTAGLISRAMASFLVNGQFYSGGGLAQGIKNVPNPGLWAQDLRITG